MVRQSEQIQVEGTNKVKGRLKITLVDVVKKDMLVKEMVEGMASD